MLVQVDTLLVGALNLVDLGMGFQVTVSTIENEDQQILQINYDVGASKFQPVKQSTKNT